MRVKYDQLIKFTEGILSKCGLDEFSLNAVTTGLCETSLRGVDSHGIRLLPHYAESAINGRKNPCPNYSLNMTFPSFGHLNADDAFGHAAGMKAIDIAMEAAEIQGICAIAVSNSSHPGAMASMALRAARKGFIAFAFTHADALTLSYNGTRPYFGTNPICFAAPRLEKEPYCLDMATSIIPWNRIKMHREDDLELPNDIAADQFGNLTTNPHSATCLLPTGEYKGYGLASMVDVLCGVMTGMAFGRTIPAMFQEPMDKPRQLGQFYLVMRVDAVVTEENFKKIMQEMTDQVRAEPSKLSEEVMLPGDKESRIALERLKNGIPLDSFTEKSLSSLAEKFGIGGLADD
jgi:ureidoglycolate dehydrogenase (NAD+)